MSVESLVSGLSWYVWQPYITHTHTHTHTHMRTSVAKNFLQYLTIYIQQCCIIHYICADSVWHDYFSSLYYVGWCGDGYSVSTWEPPVLCCPSTALSHEWQTEEGESGEGDHRAWTHQVCWYKGTYSVMCSHLCTTQLLHLQPQSPAKKV